MINRNRIAQRASRRIAGPDRGRSRMSALGGVDIKDVDQATVRDDLGFKMTDAQYGQYTEEEAAFNKRYKSVIKSNQGAIGKYKTALEGLTAAPEPEYAQGTSLDSEWNKFKGGFDMIRVVNGQNVEGVYYLPSQVINDLNGSVFNQGDGSFTGNWVHDGIYNVDVTIRGTDDKYGKELHELVQSAERQTKTAFYEHAGPQVQQANQSVADANSALAQQWGDYNTQVENKRTEIQGYIDVAQGNISQAKAAKSLRDEQKAGYKKQHEESVAHRQALFGGEHYGRG